MGPGHRLIAPAVVMAFALLALPAQADQPVRMRMAELLASPHAQPAQGGGERLQGQLSLVEAVRRALAANADIRIQAQQVRISEGAVQQASGSYDPTFVGSAHRERNQRPLNESEAANLAALGRPGVREETSRNTIYQLSLDYTLTSGTQAQLGVSLNSPSSNVNSASGIQQQTAASLRFGLRVPLQRNAGGIQFSKALRASEYQREAANEDFLQASAGVVNSTVQTYWELAARLRRLDILRASEQRAAELVGELRKLIAADQIPAAELNLALASEAEKRAARASEEQLVQQVWSTLGRLLHADSRDVFSDRPSVESMPEIDELALTAATSPERLLPHALENRPDLRSARLRERAAHELLLAAQNNLKPQLDVVTAITTNGLAEGASSLALLPALSSGQPEPSLNVGIELRWPYRNSEANGLLLSRSAARDQATIRVRDLERAIGPSIINTTSSIARTALRYQETKAATERYRVSVLNEQTKRRLGLATLIDVLNIQDRLDNSELALLQLRQEYASLKAQLLFERGALVARSKDEFEVDVQSIYGRTTADAAR